MDLLTPCSWKYLLSRTTLLGLSRIFWKVGWSGSFSQHGCLTKKHISSLSQSLSILSQVSSFHFLVYIPDHSPSLVSSLISCSLDQTGDWSNCQKKSSPLFAAPLGMILSQNKQYLYVTNYNNDSLIQCQITASNAIGKCSLMKNKSKYQFKQPSFITIM